MSDTAAFAEGHEHSEECAQLYREWRRYHAVVVDTSGRFQRNELLQAMREREAFERQLRAIGCSGEAMRRLERMPRSRSTADRCCDVVRLRSPRTVTTYHESRRGPVSDWPGDRS